MSTSNTSPSNSLFDNNTVNTIGSFCLYLLIGFTYLILFILINDALFGNDDIKMNMICNIKYETDKINVICDTDPNSNNIRADNRPYINRINNKFIFAFVISLIGLVGSLYLAKTNKDYLLPSAGIAYGSYLIPLYYLMYYWNSINNSNKIISITTYLLTTIYLTVGLSL